MASDYKVLGLRLKNGRVSPLAWTRRDLSNKEIRRAIKRFKKDADVEASWFHGWERLYNSVQEMKSEISEY